MERWPRQGRGSATSQLPAQYEDVQGSEELQERSWVRVEGVGFKYDG